MGSQQLLSRVDYGAQSRERTDVARFSFLVVSSLGGRTSSQPGRLSLVVLVAFVSVKIILTGSEVIFSAHGAKHLRMPLGGQQKSNDP